MDAFFSWLNISDGIWRIVAEVALMLFILFLVRASGGTIIEKAIRKAIQSDKYASAKAEKMREDTLISILNAIFKVAVWVFGSMIILSQLGISIGPLIAGASIAGIAIGFGAQAVVKDFVSGIFIILENQYRVGDGIEIGGVKGNVEEITIRQTILRGSDGSKHYIPNGQIGIATNLTMDYSNLILNMDIAYEADIEQVKKVIGQVGQKLSQDPKFKKQIVEPPRFSRLQDFGAHAIIVRIVGKLKPGTQWQIAGEMRLRLKEAFDKHGIEIPYQQLVIHQAEKKNHTS